MEKENNLIKNKRVRGLTKSEIPANILLYIGKNIRILHMIECIHRSNVYPVAPIRCRDLIRQKGAYSTLLKEELRTEEYTQLSKNYQ